MDVFREGGTLLYPTNKQVGDMAIHEEHLLSNVLLVTILEFMEESYGGE